MVNFGLNSASILGIFLAVAGASLYFLRSFRPELSRDQDIFFAAVGLLCGLILLFQGWRLDPILQFGQFLLTGVSVAFAVEAIRLRGVATAQAKRSTPIVDNERRASRVYRAELDEIEPYEEEPEVKRRLRGSQEPRSSSPQAYETESRRYRSRSSPYDRYDSPPERPRKRPARPSAPPTVDSYEPYYEEEGEDFAGEDYRDRYEDNLYEEPPVPPRRPSRRPRPDERSVSTRSQPSPRRQRSTSTGTRIDSGEDDRAAPANYVDYQPIEEDDDETAPSQETEY